MKENEGFYKEKEIVHELNNKRVYKLSDNLKNIIKETFGVVNKFSKIHSGLIQGFKKPDFWISIKKEKKYISMKSGQSVSLHQEKISTFMQFLKDNGISQRTINTLLFFHYGDGTLDGTGKTRFNFQYVLEKLKPRLKEANEELNKNKAFVLRFADHCIFSGIIDPDTPAQYLYHGDVNSGIIVSRVQIEKYIVRKEHSFYDCPHVGPMLIRPHARYINKQIINEESRHKVEVYWKYLNKDMEYIFKRYNG